MTIKLCSSLWIFRLPKSMSLVNVISLLIAIATFTEAVEGNPTETSKPITRVYSNYVGDNCEYTSKPMRAVECDGLKDAAACKQLCASQCDKEKKCEAFMTTVTDDVFLCELYSSCVVINDGDRRDSFGRSVHVCLSNCPVGTKPYYLSKPGENDCVSDSKYLISSFEEGRKSKKKAMSECYERCKAEKDCYQFQVSWDYDVCELFTSCFLADYEEGDGGHVGTMRSISLATLPWEYPSSCESSMWKESKKVGCLNLWDYGDYHHKALKGAVYYDSTRTKPVMTYDGSYEGCKKLGLFAVKGLSYVYIDGDEERYYSTLEFFTGWYITYNKNGACFIYGAPGTEHGCDRFRALRSDRVAMLCNE